MVNLKTLQMWSEGFTKWHEALEDRISNASDNWIDSERGEWTQALLDQVSECKDALEILAAHMEDKP